MLGTPIIKQNCNNSPYFPAIIDGFMWRDWDKDVALGEKRLRLAVLYQTQQVNMERPMAWGCMVSDRLSCSPKVPPPREQLAQSHRVTRVQGRSGTVLASPSPDDCWLCQDGLPPFNAHVHTRTTSARTVALLKDHSRFRALIIYYQYVIIVHWILVVFSAPGGIFHIPLLSDSNGYRYLIMLF